MTEVFVPGRLCLIGEHTDWSGSYREKNPSIPIGYVLVSSLNEGIYARVYSLKDESIFHYETNSNSNFTDNNINDDNNNVYEIRFDDNYIEALNKLKLVAIEGGFFSYLAGVALELLTNDQYKHQIKTELVNNKKGIKIINYKTTLPICRGLSSSAACCCLIAQSFSEVYNLNLNLHQVMDIAYKGEIRTHSKCGRMDQCVAMGKDRIALMSFDQQECNLQVLYNHSPLYFCVADLNTGKNTIQILESLHEAFPDKKKKKNNKNQSQNQDENEIEKSEQQLKEKDEEEYENGHVEMHDYINSNVTRCRNAVDAITHGDICKLAECMKSAQTSFDSAGTLMCPSELSSPRLHEIIEDESLYKCGALAIKGVGSQGDGSVQILCQSKESQAQVMNRLKELNCDPFALTIPGSSHNDNNNINNNNIDIVQGKEIKITSRNDNNNNNNNDNKSHVYSNFDVIQSE